MPMARTEEPLPVESGTPSIIIRDSQKPTKVDSYGTPRFSPINRFGISSRVEGRLLALFGSFITGLNMTGIKYLYGNNFPAPQALITRYTPSLIFVILIGLYIKYIQHNTEWYFFAREKAAFNILSIRAFFHWCSNMCMVYALVFVPVMISISLFYLWSIFAIILSYFFLNEKANIGDIILSLIGFCGVIMITDPNFESFSALSSQHIEGIILMIVSSLFYALNMVILRKKRKTYHWTQTESVAGLWSSFILTPLYIIICYYLFNIPIYELINFNLTKSEWILFGAISVFAFVAIGGITRALQLETIIIVSIVLYSEVAFGTVFQYVFLNDTTNFDSFGLWLGLLCVLMSTFCIMYRKNKVQNNEKDETLNIINHIQINERECYGAINKLT